MAEKRDFSAFMKGASEERKNIRIAISDRFKDAEGNPIEWELRPVTAEEDRELRKKHTHRNRSRVSNQQTQFFDSAAYIDELNALSVVYPDLNDKALQDSYGVMGAVDLLYKLLDSAGEMGNLTIAVNELSGLNTDIEDRIEEAKN
ncbi:MAG: phage portal protein [Bacillota bacterium]|nr:phage portal protein [Bacillota bacterium]